MKSGAVYIMANRKNGAIYTGSTAILVQRIYQHREGLIDGHTKTHGCKRLVWSEVHEDLQEACKRELQIKKWKRNWKVRMIEETNPDWRDLWFEIQG
jgi:putative endonuclease